MSLGFFFFQRKTLIYYRYDDSQVRIITVKDARQKPYLGVFAPNECAERLDKSQPDSSYLRLALGQTQYAHF